MQVKVGPGGEGYSEVKTKQEAQMRYAVIGMMLAVAGCATEPPEPSGAQLFAQNCAGCHGAGAMGSEIAPDLTGIAARNGGVFPRAEVLSTIDGFHRSPALGSEMPQWGMIFGDATSRVDVGDGVMTPVSAELLAVMEHLERLQR